MALEEFSKVSEGEILRYLSYVQNIYNQLGYLKLNQEENAEGLSILTKAERLGQILMG